LLRNFLGEYKNEKKNFFFNIQKTLLCSYLSLNREKVWKGMRILEGVETQTEDVHESYL